MKQISELTVYRSWDEINDPSFINDWMRWLDRDPNPHVFYHPVLVRSWCDTYRKIQDMSPLFCVAKIDGITLFLPLVLWKRNWKNAFLRMIVPVGFAAFDYHDPIVTGIASPELMESFWNLIFSRLEAGELGSYDEICFTGMHVPGKGASWNAEEERCPYADFSSYEDFDKFYRSRKKNLRYQVEKRKRQLSEKGSLVYHRYSADEIDAAVDALPPFLESHAQRWPNAYKAPGFYADIVSKGILSGLVHFAELRLDGRPIAWHLGYMTNGKFYYYMPAYLQEFHNYSPGRVLLSFLMQDSFENGIKVFDFLRGVYRYKEEWSDGTISLYTYESSSYGIMSRVRRKAYRSLENVKAKRTVSKNLEEGSE
jgi:CelD/BcsL family acetyltransferase involved in cellulose biosynthesis